MRKGNGDLRVLYTRRQGNIPLRILQGNTPALEHFIVYGACR